MQGWKVDDAEALARMKIPAHETAVEIPRSCFASHRPGTDGLGTVPRGISRAFHALPGFRPTPGEPENYDVPSEREWVASFLVGRPRDLEYEVLERP